MRLLDTETGQFVEKDPKQTKYAILSHTWDTEKPEQTYEQLREIQRRYNPEERRRIDPEGGAPSSPDSPHGDQRRSSPQPPPPQSPSDSTSLTTSLPEALGRFTQSEVEALLRLFGEVYGLTRPTPAPAPSDHPAPAVERQPTEPSQSIWDDPDLSFKIREACAVARENGYRYIWIDSCCIDKSSSSELSEAINSMYEWYSLAEVCYAYLADVPPGANHHAEGSSFRKSRWFTRGWTLQELIAPLRVEFLSQDWALVGTKHALVDLVEGVTGINARALLHLKPLEEFSVAQRLSWAGRRKTTREEDRAYSLLGIFGINIPTLYGEGDRAFRRLQEQIMQRIPDQSLFAWGNVYMPPVPQLPSGPIPTPEPTIFTAYTCQESAFATSPDVFADSGNIRRLPLSASPNHHEIECTLTPYGIRAQFEMIPLTSALLSAIFPYCEAQLELPDETLWYVAILSGCEHKERPGYLLGHIWYIWPSVSSINYVHTGYIQFNLQNGYTSYPDLIALPPETIERFRPRTEVKTVYISHPQSDPTDSDPLRSLRYQPYTAIKLVLLRETRDALRSRGYSTDLRGPDPDHPTTHRLTLSKDNHAITIRIEFEHTLNNNGDEFTITAEVETSECRRVQLDSAPDSDWEDHCTVSWRDFHPWNTLLGHRTVKLSLAGAGTLTVDLGLDFAGIEFYIICIDVQSDVPPASSEAESMLPVSDSVVESAGDEGKEVELSGDNSRSGAIDTEDWKASQEVEAGGREVTLGEARDLEATSDKAGDEDGGST